MQCSVKLYLAKLYLASAVDQSDAAPPVRIASAAMSSSSSPSPTTYTFALYTYDKRSHDTTNPMLSL